MRAPRRAPFSASTARSRCTACGRARLRGGAVRAPPPRARVAPRVATCRAALVPLCGAPRAPHQEHVAERDDLHRARREPSVGAEGQHYAVRRQATRTRRPRNLGGARCLASEEAECERPEAPSTQGMSADGDRRRKPEPKRGGTASASGQSRLVAPATGAAGPARTRTGESLPRRSARTENGCSCRRAEPQARRTLVR